MMAAVATNTSDGRQGYPDGNEGEEIPLPGVHRGHRDAYDAMANDSP